MSGETILQVHEELVFKVKKRNLSIRIILILLWPVYPAVRGSFLSWSCTNWNGGVCFCFYSFFVNLSKFMGCDMF